MNPKLIENDCWPTPLQTLLLHAALDQDNGAMTAWQAWRQQVDLELDPIDPGSFRLLPLVYHNLQQQQVNDSQLPRLKGIYRKTWYKNHMLFHRVATVLQAFQTAGIPTILLKGAALALLYYKDASLRPMTDFDLLVPTEQATAAIQLLSKLGWTPKEGSITTLQEPLFSINHAQSFKDGQGGEFDLHWHVLVENCYPNADRDFWADTIPLSINGIPTQTLNATDQLFHICVHGIRWNLVPPVRWVADAILILRNAEIDWQRLISQIQARGFVLRARSALTYLADTFDAPIPPDVLQALASIPTTRREQREFDTLTATQGRFGELPSYWFRYLRHQQQMGSTGWRQYNPFVFIRFLQYRGLFDSTWQLLQWVINRASFRLSNAVRLSLQFPWLMRIKPKSEASES